MGLKLPGGEDDGPSAEAERRELLDRRAMVQEAGGVLAVQDEFVREGVVRSGPPCRVKVTRVRFDDSPPADSFGLLPVFRFVVTDDDGPPGELHSFAIDAEIAADALHRAHPAYASLRAPAPCYEIEETLGERTEGGVIHRGIERLLSVEMVTLEDPPPHAVGGTGIRFAVSEKTRRPLYSFAMNWPLAFVVLGVAWEEPC